METYNIFTKELNGDMQYLHKRTQWILTIFSQRNLMETYNFFTKELNGDMQYLYNGTQWRHTISL